MSEEFNTQAQESRKLSGEEPTDMPTITVLVVSRTARLLNGMLSSLEQSFSGDHRQLKIICSWNGEPEEESLIQNNSRFEFLIAQRKPYHFAANQNDLAQLATSDLLVFANDDLILGKYSVDYAIQALQQDSAGIVGIRLAKTTGKLAHAGIHFDQNHTPYHMLEGLVEATDPRVSSSGKTSAVTGAFMAIRRSDFRDLGGFSTDFKTCCEDVEFCLRLRSETKRSVWYCAEATGIHDGESTRQAFEAREKTSEDIVRIRRIRESWLNKASTSDLNLELQLAATESDDLRSVVQSMRGEIDGYSSTELAEDCALKEIQARESRMLSKSRALREKALASIGVMT